MKICVLVDKRERRQVEVPLDYVGFVVEKGFLVGYGLDCGEQMRTLPEIYVVGEGLRCSNASVGQAFSHQMIRP